MRENTLIVSYVEIIVMFWLNYELIAHYSGPQAALFGPFGLRSNLCKP